MTVLGFVGRHFRRHTVWLVIAVLASGVYALATGAVVALIEPVFSEVLLAERDVVGELGSLPGVGEPNGDAASDARVAGFKRRLDAGYESLKRAFGVTEETVLYFVPIVFVVIFTTRSLADFVSGYSFNQIGLRVTTDIRDDLYGAVLRQSSRFHAEHPSGELMSRIVSDVSMMQTAVSTRVVDLLQQSMTLLVLLVVLVASHPRLALICLVAIPLLVLPIVRFGQGMRRASHRAQERMADLANLVGEGVRGHRVVKAFGMESFEHERFKQATHRHLKVNLWAQVLANASSPVIENLAVIGGALLLVAAGRQIRAGELSAPVFVAFLVNLLWMYEPVRKLNKVNLVIQQSLGAARRVLEILQVPNEIQDRVGAVPIREVEREIRFEKVAFSYGAQPVLQDFDLVVPRGEVVALVGPSGAGKSTVVNLLPRFFDPDSGRVTIDGTDIRDVTLASLRGLIGLVTQDTVLFDDSIRNNIAYGRSDLPLEAIRAAAAAAYADEFVMAQPEGYDAVIGEAGLRLSGGERQRLAIARALLKDPPILILDEATSHLDTESEALVQKALYNLMQGRTTLVIAHRLSTVQRANRISVMDGGRIVEQGSHDELLSAGGLYRRLYDLQFETGDD